MERDIVHGTMFLKSIDTSGYVKTGEYIFKLLKDVILEVGPSNVSSSLYR